MYLINTVEKNIDQSNTATYNKDNTGWSSEVYLGMKSWFKNWKSITVKTTPVFLPGESQGQRSLVGCHLWGRTVGHDWGDLAAAAAKTIISE